MSSRSPGGADVNILPIEFFIVACSFALFHTFIIVTNYIDIGRKMNYNGNRQFRRLELYNMHIRSDFIRSTVVVYSNCAAECFTVSGSNPIGGIIFLVFRSTYVRYGRKKVHVRYLSSPDEFLFKKVMDTFS